MANFLSKLKPIVMLAAAAVGCAPGCTQHSAFINSAKETKEADRQLLKQVSYEQEVKPTVDRAESGAPAPFALDTDSAGAFEAMQSRDEILVVT